MKKLLIVAFLFTLTSCSLEKSKTEVDYVGGGKCSEKGDVPGIVNGKLLNESSVLAKSTVLVMQGLVDENGKIISQSLCTGVLIDNDVVLTAAHCADYRFSQPQFESKIDVYFSARPECEPERALIERVRVSQVVLHPAWVQAAVRRNAGEKNYVGKLFADTTTPELERLGDIALLKLGKPAPADKIPASLPAQMPNLEANQSYAVGYGTPLKYGGEGHFEIILRYARLKQLMSQSVAAQLLFDERGSTPSMEENLEKILKNKTQNTANQELLVFDQLGGGVCSGDSGGPGLIVQDGKTIVIGVASSVYSVSTRPKCEHIGIYTSAYFYDQWIQEQYKKLKGPLVPPLKKADVK